MTDLLDRSIETADRSYWSDRIAAVTDGSRIDAPINTIVERVHEALVLDGDCATRMQQLARGNATAMFTLACGGLAAALSFFLGRNAVILSVPPCVARSDIKAGILPLVIETRGHADLRAFLGHVKQIVIGAFLHATHDVGTAIEVLKAASNVGLRVDEFSECFPEDGRPDCELGFNGIDTLSLTCVSGEFSLHQARSLLAMWAHCLDHYDRLDMPLTEDVVYPAWLMHEIQAASCGESMSFPAETLVDLIGASFAIPGDHVALRDMEGDLSYQDLDRLSAALAADLVRTMAIGPGSRVGIMVPRSRRMVIALVAVIRAGATFVPMSCDWSSSRCLDIVNQTNAALLMIDSSMMMDVLEYGVPAYVLDLQLPTLIDAGAPDLHCDPDSIAYIMFTSGSSGSPKGVEVSHRSIANTLSWRQSCYGLSPSHVSLQIPPMYFDSAIEDVLSFLVSGSCLLLPIEDQRLQTDHLRKRLADGRATHVMLVPGIYQKLLASDPALFDDFECITLAGEAVAESLVRDHFRHHPSIRLFNEYGPTENAVCSTAAELFDDGCPPTIGRAIANTFVYVVDDALRPVVLGCSGELLVGGAGVAAGYLGNDQLTDERFVSPHWLKGQRAYRTGDRGRYTTTGTLEYLGRIDDTMLKVNGVRIEPGEIESCMLGHAQVSAATVGVDACGSLLAVFTGLVDEDVLRDWLSRRLPYYMLPRMVVRLREFPMLGNGKVDRTQAIADGQQCVATRDKTTIAPSTATEAILIELWRDVLQAPGIGVTDNYFRSGGDSILAIQITAAIERMLGISVTMAELYASPSVAQLARLVDDRASIGTPVVACIPLPWQLDSEEFVELQAKSQSVFPISDVSLGMLFHALRDESSPVYHDQTAFFVSGFELTSSAVERVLRAMCASHPVLRTTFQLTYSRPVQAVAHLATPELHCENWQTHNHSEQDQKLQDYLSADRLKGFAIDCTPPWRMALFNCGARGFAISMSLHHALMDGWSSALFWDEFFRRIQGSWTAPDVTPEANCQDLVIEQTLLASDREIRTYWAKELADARAFELPPSFVERETAEAVASDTMACEIQARLDRVIAARLREISDRLGISVRNVYLLAYLTALSRVSYSQDFVAGLVENVRPQKTGGDRVLGCFLNTVPLRFPLDFNAPVSDLLRALDAKTTELKRYGRASLPTILEAGGHNAASALFSSVFVYLNFHVLEATKAVGRVEQDVFGHDRANTLLDLIVNESDAQTAIKLKYDARHVSNGLARGFMDCFIGTLDVLSRRPDMPLSLPEILGRAHARLEGPLPSAYHHPLALIRSVAMRHGPLQALVSGHAEPQSYAELLQCVDAISAKLVPHATGRHGQARIALIFDQRNNHLIAMLASLAVGACFVPIEANTPPERLASMFDDAQIDLILTDTDLQHALPILRWAGLLAMSTPDVPLPIERDGDSLAYVLFTSGSTGRPKGVGIRLDSLSNLLQATPGIFAIDPGSRCLQFSSVSFDASIHEMLIPLGRGATVFLAPDAARQDAALLTRYIDTHHVDNVVLTPSVATLLDWTLLPNVKTLITVGEPPLPSDAKMWSRGRRYINAYGPTEATVCTSAFVGQLHESDVAVPIGTPLAGVTIEIIDAQRQPMVCGALGEIAISGCNVADGYVGHAQSSPSGFARSSVGRAYFSGDLGLIDAAGRLRFSERRDGQVKRNGVRIERDGIAAFALQQDFVSRAVALFDGALLVLFVVFCVPNSGTDTRDDESLLAARLAQHLGPSQSPDLIIATDDIPRLPSGKLDERTLWALLRERGADTDTRELSSEFRMVVERILGHRRFSAEDNFLDIGGDSLKSIRLAAALQKEFHRAPSVAEIINASSLSELENILRFCQATRITADTTCRHDDTVALTRTQRRLVALGLFDPGAATYNLPAAVQLNGMLRTDALIAALGVLVRMHPVLHSCLDFSGEDPRLQLLDPSGFELVLQEAAAENALSIACEFLSRPFDLTQDCLSRFCLIRTRDNEHILAVSLHHAICDGISIEILMEDLFDAYDRLAAGESITCRESAEAPGQHAHREEEWLRGPGGHAADVFWQSHASRPGTIRTLPRCKVPSESKGAGHVRLELPVSTLSDYLRRNHSDSAFDVFLAGFGAWLASATGASMNSFVTTVSTRDLAGAQRAIGPFINTLLLQAQAMTESGLESIARSRQNFAERWKQRNYPFDLVATLLREAGLDPASACGFTWVGDLANAAPSVKELHAAPLDVSFPVVKADLWVYVVRIGANYRITFEYDRQHFTHAQIEAWTEEYAATIRRLIAPVIETTVTQTAAEPPGITKRTRNTPPVSPLIRRPLFEDGSAPIALQPRVSGLRLIPWMEQNQEQFRTWLNEHGALLLRGFDVSDEHALHRLLTVTGVAALEYRYRSTPRRELESRIYSSTEYPAAEKIPQHHENAYTTHFPDLLWFTCLDDRFSGGCTPLSDGAQVYAQLDPRLRTEFIERGLRYVRHYDNRVDLSWQDTFQTTERSLVEAACTARGIDWTWRDDGTLETAQNAQVAIRHPVTDHNIWFNQAHLFFRSGQDTAGIVGAYPRHVTFGDGGEIPAAQIEAIRRCYETSERRFTWSRGDVLVLDNLRHAHGRDPYTGTRKIVVAMTNAMAVKE